MGTSKAMIIISSLFRKEEFMKRFITIAGVIFLLLTVSGPGMCEVLNCAGTPGVIDRGSESFQYNCLPFDFENPSDYLNPGQYANRAVFKICDCIENVIAGDDLDISMEILVDSRTGSGPTTGDHGVYWADVNDEYDEWWGGSLIKIPMDTYTTQEQACQDVTLDKYFLYPPEEIEYRLANGVPSELYNGDTCILYANERVVQLQNIESMGIIATGYRVTRDDQQQNKSLWAIDIPKMRVDPDRISGGEKIWVSICLSQDYYPYFYCCQEVYIGELRCENTCDDNIGDAIGLFDPDASAFYLKSSLSGGAADTNFRFGPKYSGWTPIVGDWNRNGQATIGLFNPGQSRFYLKNTNAGGSSDADFGFGPKAQNWQPIAGDWDGDGQCSIGLYDPLHGTFYLKNALSGGPADRSFRFGPLNAGWQPIAGDWDGDGTDSIGLYSPQTGMFYFKNALSGGAADISLRYGPKDSTWMAFCGDWDGNGTDGVGLFNPGTSTFYLKNSFSPGNAETEFGFGPDGMGWMPLSGSW
ncbi:MAG: VCBS repeat-containing protein [Desulfosalsimonadaceae bacterium]